MRESPTWKMCAVADLMHHGAQRADVALVLVVGVLAAPRLRMQPGVGRGDHALRRGLHRPGFRRAVVVGQEALDRGLGGDAADAGGADAVGEHDRDALQARAAARAGSGRRENPDWSPSGPCRNAARPRSSVRAAFDAPFERMHGCMPGQVSGTRRRRGWPGAKPLRSLPGHHVPLGFMHSARGVRAQRLHAARRADRASARCGRASHTASGP